MFAQKVKVVLESVAWLEVRVVTRSGVREGRRGEGKGEGPYDCSLVVSVDHTETTLSRKFDFNRERAGSASSALSRDVQSVASGSDKLSTADFKRSKVGRYWNRLNTASWRV